MNKHPIKTTCPYCGVGCGIVTEIDADKNVRVRGDENHPANFGRLCAKGAALAETLSADGRLLHPYIHGKQTTWDDALNSVATGFQHIIDEHGPDAVAFYVSGQLLTEDYYVANKLMKGFIGSGNIDTNSRLCMSSAVAGYKRAFGGDIVPCSYDDLEHAELLVLTGSNLAWCHPVLFQRIRKAKQENKHTKVIVIDPRKTASTEIADLHLPIRPGGDAILFNGLLNYLRSEDVLDWEFLEKHTEGFAAAIKTAKQTAESIPAVAAACGLEPDDVGRFFRLFARTDKTITLFSQGINQSSSGTDKVNSIINCHLATGRIGKPGSGPFSITGQPNAMGGREVGGLASTLAAHMDFEAESIDRVQRFWQTSNIAQAPGLKAVDLFNAIGDGKVKAVWIMATNPMVSLPDSNKMRAALKQCELVVVSDCIQRTDTTAYADVLLPAAAWGERDGTVTNSERRISRQRAFMHAPGDAKPDWWMITQVAQRMGYTDAFNYKQPVDIFREHAQLSGFENSRSRAFDISGLAEISDKDYEQFEPVRWPIHSESHHSVRNEAELFTDGYFFTSNNKARLLAIEPRPPEHSTCTEFPLVLNTGRIRDQWHTMTRTGKSARLCAHTPEPYIETHPEDALRYKLQHGQLARVTSDWGEAVLRVQVSDAQQIGSLFTPIHWSDQLASQARADALVNPVTDPVSGEPEFKHTPVKVTAYQPAWSAFVLSRTQLDLPDVNYWVINRTAHGWRYELAGDPAIENPAQWAHDLLSSDNLPDNQSNNQWLELEDRGAGRYHCASITENWLDACLLIAPGFQLPQRNWLLSLFDKPELDDSDRAYLLSGRPPPNVPDAGPTVCSCFGVGRNTLLTTIRSNSLTTVTQIGELLNAGTNCGSCIPELEQLLNMSKHEEQSQIKEHLETSINENMALGRQLAE